MICGAWLAGPVWGGDFRYFHQIGSTFPIRFSKLGLDIENLALTISKHVSKVTKTRGFGPISIETKKLLGATFASQIVILQGQSREIP